MNRYDRKIIRTQNAGVFLANVEEFNPETRVAVLTNSRRLWYWDGAASLSQLAMEGTTAPANCKFPTEVSSMIVCEVIEMIDTTPAARASIDGVPVWKW